MCMCKYICMCVGICSDAAEIATTDDDRNSGYFMKILNIERVSLMDFVDFVIELFLNYLLFIYKKICIRFDELC